MEKQKQVSAERVAALTQAMRGVAINGSYNIDEIEGACAQLAAFYAEKRKRNAAAKAAAPTGASA